VYRFDWGRAKSGASWRRTCPVPDKVQLRSDLASSEGEQAVGYGGIGRDRLRILTSTERIYAHRTMFLERVFRAPEQSDIGHLQKRGTTMAANNEDAALVIQILRWGAEIGLDEATHEIFAEGFDPEFATADDKAVRTMLAFGETVATLVKHKTLDKDLVEDLWWVDGAWARVGTAAKKARERLGEPRLYENFEALATS